MANMLKILNAGCALFICTSLPAQITIHSSDLPNAGDSVLTSIATTTGGNNPSLSGSSYSWDYSTLTPDLQRYEKFDSPLTFPSVYSLLFSIFTTTYGRDNYTLTSIPLPGVTLDAAYDFYKKSSGDLRQTGSGYVINGTPLPFVYTSADVQLRFPLDYNNVDSCTYKFGLPIPSIGYYGETGHRVNTVDGWGTLTTPFGTFSTLRVRSEVSAVDTIYVDAVSFGANLPARVTREYKWYATGMKVPVLEVDALVAGGTETVATVSYIDSSRAGVPQVGIAENTGAAHVSVYPNPCAGQLQISYELVAAMKIRISISTVLGQTAAVVSEEYAPAGKHTVSLNVKELGLDPGIYFVNIESKGLHEVRRIVVTK